MVRGGVVGGGVVRAIVLWAVFLGGVECESEHVWQLAGQFSFM